MNIGNRDPVKKEHHNKTPGPSRSSTHEIPVQQTTTLKTGNTIRIYIWNFKSLHEEAKTQNDINEMDRLNVDGKDISETRWTDAGTIE